MNDFRLKLRIGLLVLGAVVLAVVLLLVLGLADLFTAQVPMTTWFSESVQGLSVGAPVKYKGVPIGTVSRIGIQVEDQLIRVEMNIRLDSFVRRHHEPSGGNREQAFRDFIRRELNAGLRCRLDYAGITGLRYVELDYYAPAGEDTPAPPVAVAPGELYVPAVPSLFKDLLNSLALSLDRIAHIRFEEISDGLTRTIGETARLLSNPELQSTVRHLEEMAVNLDRSAASISRVLTEERLERTLNQLDADLAGFHNLTEELRTAVQSAELSRSSRDFRDAVRAVREAAETVTSSRQDLRNLTADFKNALDAVQELANFLRDDPSALVRGKSARP